MKVNILGTEYTVHLIDEQDEAMIEANLQGYCDWTSKKIVVLKHKKSCASDLNNIEELTKKTLKHEIIHAFLFESGIELGMLFHNEEMVEWLSYQFPNIENALKGVLNIDNYK